jgi:hypothetical protein
VIARGLDCREIFRAFRPGFDLENERERRAAAAGRSRSVRQTSIPTRGRPWRRCGIRGFSSAQPAHAEAILRALDLPVDVIGTSHCWGGEKPSPAFFERVVRDGGGDASSILYVGDRPDNDARPALAAGLKTCLIRRSPWGHILDMPAVAEKCLFRIDSLDELPALVARHNTTSG